MIHVVCLCRVAWSVFSRSFSRTIQSLFIHKNELSIFIFSAWFAVYIIIMCWTLCVFLTFVSGLIFAFFFPLKFLLCKMSDFTSEILLCQSCAYHKTCIHACFLISEFSNNYFDCNCFCMECIHFSFSQCSTLSFPHDHLMTLEDLRIPCVYIMMATCHHLSLTVPPISPIPSYGQ